MKQKGALIILLFIFTLTSCNPILMKMYGIKNPDTESEKTILKFAKKKHLHTDNIVTVNSSDFLAMLKIKGIPEADIFDNNGQYIEYRPTDTSCNAGLFKFIPDLNRDGKYNKTGKTNLQIELNKLRDLKGSKLQPLPSADFYVLIYWSVWTGKLNKDHVKIWEDYAYANKNANIRVLKVNLDYQEHWEKSDRDKIIKQLEKK
jgi:hypothetical protein